MSAVAENIQTEMPAPLVFTDSAAAKVAELVAEEGIPDLKLRVFVQGGGCSGFQYGFTFDEVTNEDDTTMSKNGVSLLIDAMSYQYLVGAEIDYKEDLEGAQFVIKNPNANSTCGCGSSFSVGFVEGLSPPTNKESFKLSFFFPARCRFTRRWLAERLLRRQVVPAASWPRRRNGHGLPG